MLKTTLRHRGYLKNTGNEIDGGRLTEWIPVIRPNTVSSLSSRRIVLLGQAGVGKSASGNTILRQKVFRSEMTMNAVTSECSEEHAIVSDRSVSVVDTPPFFDTHMKPEELMMEITRSVYLSSPGPHAFLIVFPVNMRFTEQEQQIAEQVEILFGKGVLKYSIILFTHGDQLEESIEELTEENSRLRHLVDRCGGRFHVFNNRDQNKKEQVNVLLQMIDTMIEQNGGHYSNQMFEYAQRFRQEEVERRLRDEEEKTICEFKAFYTNNQCTAATTRVAAVFGMVALAAGFFAVEGEIERKKQ